MKICSEAPHISLMKILLLSRYWNTKTNNYYPVIRANTAWRKTFNPHGSNDMWHLSRTFVMLRTNIMHSRPSISHHRGAICLSLLPQYILHLITSWYLAPELHLPPRQHEVLWLCWARPPMPTMFHCTSSLHLLGLPEVVLLPLESDEYSDTVEE